MLEGLEVVEVNFKALQEIIDYRIEAEYFGKRFLTVESCLNKILTVPFFEVADYENGRAYSSESFSEEPIEQGIRIAKIGDVTNKRNNTNWSYLTREEFNSQNGRLLNASDILMTLTGDPPDVGKVQIFFSDSIASTWNQRVARIYLKDFQSAFVNEQVFYCILSNKYCREQLERLAKGIRQRNLGIECIEKLKLPILNNLLQNQISNIVSSSYNCLINADKILNNAEQLLLQELGITETLWQTKGVAINNKSFKESFAKSGRLDAEYYQPKYEAIMQVASFGGNESGSLDSFVNIKKSIEPGSDAYQETGIPFLRVSNISKLELSEPDIYLDEKLYSIETLFPLKDTILLTKDGSVGLAYKVEEDMKAITSSALLHLQVIDTNVILPDYLTLVLNSPVVQLQAERDCGGSIIQHWRIDEIRKVIIPLLAMPTQQQIASLIQQSFQLRKQSKHLLEIAKQAVEMAIEIDENTAIEFINANT